MTFTGDSTGHVKHASHCIPVTHVYGNRSLVTWECCLLLILGVYESAMPLGAPWASLGHQYKLVVSCKAISELLRACPTSVPGARLQLHGYGQDLVFPLLNPWNLASMFGIPQVHLPSCDFSDRCLPPDGLLSIINPASPPP